MSVSKTLILNKALTLAGAAPVTNIDDSTNNARILSRVYELSLKEVLGRCKWNFATKRDALSLLSVTLDFYDPGEGNVYQKPNDMIRIFDTSPSGAACREEGDYIISDSDGLAVRYVYYLDDPTKYSAPFITAFTDKLVSDIAFQIVNSGTLAEKYLQKYEKISLPAAISANSQFGIQQTLQDDAWENAKYSDIQTSA